MVENVNHWSHLGHLMNNPLADCDDIISCWISLAKLIIFWVIFLSWINYWRVDYLRCTIPVFTWIGSRAVNTQVLCRHRITWITGL
jgi:hypothetical protein